MSEEVRISDCEILLSNGMLRVDRTGHGIYRGMYRKPTRQRKRYYYRLYSPDVSTRWAAVVDLMAKHFPGVEFEATAEWARMAGNLADLYNDALRHNKDARDVEKAKLECAPQDILQNDTWVDLPPEWGDDDE